MATILVTTIGPSGAGSLADAVDRANSTEKPDRIVFDQSLKGQTLALAGDLVLTRNLQMNGDLNGDGDADVTIDVAGGRLVNQAGADCRLESLVISGGRVPSKPVAGVAASAIVNGGTLTLSYCHITGNTSDMSAVVPSGPYGVTASTIVNTGALGIVQCEFSSNQNIGSHGRYYDEWYGGGGGHAATVVNYGSLVLGTTSFRQNLSIGGEGAKGGYMSNGYDAWGYQGGDGGDAAGTVLNLGLVSGQCATSNNSATEGEGGWGGRFGGSDGSPGTSASGLLNIDGGTGDFLPLEAGTMGGDAVTLGWSSNFAGLGGADHIEAGPQSRVDGGAGNDVIVVWGSYDSNGQGLGNVVRGGLGADTIMSMFTVSGGSYDGGGGRDTIDFSLDHFDGKRISLEREQFRLFQSVFSGFENVTGSQGDDELIGSSRANTLLGDDGDDTIEGRGGGDQLDGGLGRNTLSYEASAGGVSVNLRTASVSGGDADGDKIAAFANVTGSALSDVLAGDGGGNILTGGSGDDILNGGRGADILEGGEGSDRLMGDAGHDVLTGGEGVDVFVLENVAASSDLVTDFLSKEDRFELRAESLDGGLAPGELLASQLAVNTTGFAGDADDRLIYNRASGELAYDPDGTGVESPWVIAVLTGASQSLGAADFMIV